MLRPAILLGSACLLLAASCRPDRSGMAAPADPNHAPRAAAAPFLAMPATASGRMPQLLSQAGAFAAVGSLTPADALIGFSVNSPLWSDGAVKERWLALPIGTRIGFAATGAWSFPAGTVFVKHFALPVDERAPGRLRRLETRLLVRDAAGGVYGVTYRWRDDQRDAELLADGQDEDITVHTADGGTRTQRWHYPSRSECLQCHSQAAGLVLGVTARQLNGTRVHAGQITVNQITAWSRAGLLDPAPDDRAIAGLARLSAIGDGHASLEQRVRSYLDANCAHCHRPGAVGFANYDARYDTPLDQQNLIRGEVIIDHGIDRARNLMPKDPWRSMVLVRLEAEDQLRMPPLARNVVDREAAAVVRQWIATLPGKPALPPPVVDPPAGSSAVPLRVTLRDDDPEAIIRYTVDGSLPDSDSPAYHEPLVVDTPLTLRAKAFRPGYSSSIVVNATFIVEKPR
jgi:uncharacterized repeat protein (TIGR03806 family)